MNIAHLLPYSARFPLKKHNGRYEWALALAREQAKQGHKVTIYAAPGSHDNSAIRWKSLGESLGDKNQNNKALLQIAFQNTEHDIFHSHFDALHYSLAHFTQNPIVCTQHWFPNESITTAARQFTGDNVFVVPVTRYMEQKDKQLGINTTRMIYHGINLSLFHPVATPALKRFIFVGRITPSKGVREAVMMAKETKSFLDIVGKINDADQAYWQTILPYIDNKTIRYLGPQPQEIVAELMANARAFLFPSQQEEAFGQVTIEAQACGTPVIISDVGASSELVQQGVTGFVCTSRKDFLEAIKKIDSIDRDACREFAETFSDATMFQAYDALYAQLTGVEAS
ncbi:MAG TPA: glycosyltransferase [Candidatus Saccharimonadales bacterium]|nr:glycosyltransferase [Candidatus Saccharimonadales bacterium]